MIPARLRIDQRSVKRPGQPPKHFAVPIIEILGTMTDLISGAGMAVPALTRGNGHPALPEGAPLPADASFTMPVSAATPAEALAKTPQEAAEAVAVKRAARVEADEIVGKREIPSGPNAGTLLTLARAAGVTKAKLADAIAAGAGVERPMVEQVNAVVAALTDAERGRVADELNLDWRAPA
jgi:hypothetical protein